VLEKLLKWADVVLVEQPWQFSYCRRLRPDRQLVLSARNVELRTRASHAEAAGVMAYPNSLLLRWVRRVEAQAVLRADLVVAVSEADRDALIGCYDVSPERVVVAANGSDTRRFVPARPERKLGLRKRLGLSGGTLAVFMAGHRKSPDVAALAWVRRLARRMSDCTFVVIGDVLRPTAEGNRIATGWVEDPVTYLQAADLFLCPVEHGGGTKLKLFDALAAGLPAVAFAETLKGTSLRDGEHLLVSDHSEDALEKSTRRLLGDSSLAARLERELVELVERRSQSSVVRHTD